MKKTGFTLAEILVSLAIVGVIAALTLPTLISDTTSTQIGPKLAKAVSTFEQANENLLNNRSADSLSDAGLTSNLGAYIGALSNFLKINQDGNGIFTTKDGMRFVLTVTNPSPGNAGTPAYMQRLGDVSIDINGNNQPNRNATDIFHFSWWNDGSLRPKGSVNWDGGAGGNDPGDPNPNFPDVPVPDKGAKDRRGGTEHWITKCNAGTIPVNGTYCAGHIFENNLRVLYE